MAEGREGGKGHGPASGSSTPGAPQSGSSASGGQRGTGEARGGSRKPGDHAGGQETPTSEWVVAAISTLLVLAAIAFLAYDAMTTPSTSPDVRVVVDSIVPGQANHIVRFTAMNLGGSTASNVQVSGALRLPGDTVTVERSVATLDFVPAGSNRKGGLFFTHDPRGYDLTMRAEGFNTP